MDEGATNTEAARSSSNQSEKAWLARIWGGFDTKYMKPLLTHSKPTLIDTLPPCCLPVARMLTTSEQLHHVSYSFISLILSFNLLNSDNFKMVIIRREVEYTAIRTLSYALTMSIVFGADLGLLLPRSQDFKE